MGGFISVRANLSNVAYKMITKVESALQSITDLGFVCVLINSVQEAQHRGSNGSSNNLVEGECDGYRNEATLWPVGQRAGNGPRRGPNADMKCTLFGP